MTAYERLDRNRAVAIRWWLADEKRYQRKSTGLFVRDDRDVVDPEKEREVVAFTQQCYDELMAGRSVGLGEPGAEQGDSGSPAVDANGTVASTGPLTLKGGFEIATTVETGMYVVETEHLKEVRRAARDIEWVLATDDLGRPRYWDDLKYSHVRDLWQRLAKRFVASGQGGAAWTERCVVILLQVSNWLFLEEKIERAVPVRKTWREQMRREWEQLTSAPIVQKDLRHTEEEIARIFGALNHEHVDPRIALAVELGAEARLGQVRRLRRTGINLSPVGAFGLGRVIVQGSGKKTGVMRDLTPEERAAIDRALEGYLYDLEREFQEGVRTDYFVFQAGRLRYDVPPSRRPRRGAAALMPSVRRARTDLPDKPINKRTLTDMFHALETVGGVVTAEGRGWYGIRRKATDVYEDYESDERVLNSATGHSNSDTRRKNYQQRNRDLILAKTAVTRRRVRAGAFGHATADGDALEEGS